MCLRKIALTKPKLHSASPRAINGLLPRIFFKLHSNPCGYHVRIHINNCISSNLSLWDTRALQLLFLWQEPVSWLRICSNIAIHYNW